VDTEGRGETVRVVAIPEGAARFDAGDIFVVGTDLNPSQRIGLGVENVDDHLVVTTVVPGMSAAQAGVSPGDVVVAVDGVPTNNLTSADFRVLVHGDPGTTTTLLIRRGDGSAHTISIVR